MVEPYERLTARQGDSGCGEGAARPRAPAGQGTGLGASERARCQGSRRGSRVYRIAESWWGVGGDLCGTNQAQRCWRTGCSCVALTPQGAPGGAGDPSRRREDAGLPPAVSAEMKWASGEQCLGAELVGLRVRGKSVCLFCLLSATDFFSFFHQFQVYMFKAGTLMFVECH